MTRVLLSLAGIALAGFCTISITVATNWVTAVNAERREHHDAIHELQFRSQFINGDVKEAPVTAIKK